MEEKPPTGEPGTVDTVLDGRVVLHQPRSGYRAAVDPILLAAAARTSAGDRVADLGCGVGTAMLCLALRVPDSHVTGLEIQETMAAFARQSVMATGVADRVTVVNGSVADPPERLMPPGGFDHVMLNPPYLDRRRHRPSPAQDKATATSEGETGLDVWLVCARQLLCHRGRVTIIHRADRVDDILGGLRDGFGAVEILPVYSSPALPAKRVIVRARRDVRTPATILPGLTLHGEDGAFTATATGILRRGDALCQGGGIGEQAGR